MKKKLAYCKNILKYLLLCLSADKLQRPGEEVRKHVSCGIMATGKDGKPKGHRF